MYIFRLYIYKSLKEHKSCVFDCFVMYMYTPWTRQLDIAQLLSPPQSLSNNHSYIPGKYLCRHCLSSKTAGLWTSFQLGFCGCYAFARWEADTLHVRHRASSLTSTGAVLAASRPPPNLGWTFWLHGSKMQQLNRKGNWKLTSNLELC